MSSAFGLATINGIAASPAAALLGLEYRTSSYSSYLVKPNAPTKQAAATVRLVTMGEKVEQPQGRMTPPPAFVSLPAVHFDTTKG